MSAFPGSAPVARALAAFLAGLIFGAGLALAQMIDPSKVLAFLDILGAWDPSLALVMGGAVVLAALGFRGILERPRPLLDTDFHLPSSTRIDRKLVQGALLFGIGWGAAGYCPGPAIASLGFANAEALWFVPAMLAGAGLQRWWARRAPAAPRAAGV